MPKSEQGRLILVRYLLLMSHLIGASTLLTSRAENVLASLPYEYTQDDFNSIDYQYTIDLSLSVAFTILELVLFGTGLTMFSSLTTLISIISHTIGTILLCFFSFDQWDSRLYWWIFGFGNCLPLTFNLGSILQDLLSSKINKF